MDEELITTKELCEWLKIAKSTASRWRNEGMPYIGKSSALRYKKSELLKWLDEKNKEEK